MGGRPKTTEKELIIESGGKRGKKNNVKSKENKHVPLNPSDESEGIEE